MPRRMSKLSKRVQDPEFKKAYRKDPVATMETSLGRSLTDEEKEAVQNLKFDQLKKIIDALLSNTVLD